MVLKMLQVLVRRVAVAVSTWVTMDVGDVADIPELEFLNSLRGLGTEEE